MKKFDGMKKISTGAAGVLILLTLLFLPARFRAREPEQTEIDEGIRDSGISIDISRGRAFESNYTAARIRLDNIHQMRTLFSWGYFSDKTEKASTLTNRIGAVFAINGDYYRFKEDGLIVRNGIPYRNRCDGSRDVLVVDGEGDFHLYRKAEGETIRTEDAWQAFTFGPALVVDGEKQTEFTDNDNAAFQPAGRMCIAQTGRLEYLCIAVDGPESEESKGMTIPQLAEFAAGIEGVQNAYNLDGGMSISMIHHGKRMNQPAKERPVCDIIGFIGTEAEDKP